MLYLRGKVPVGDEANALGMQGVVENSEVVCAKEPTSNGSP